MVAGVSFKNVKNTIKDVTLRKRTNLSPQSTQQLPFLASPTFFPVPATQAQLEYEMDLA